MIYQRNFSKINRSVLDKKIRRVKAKKIAAVIKDFANKRNIDLSKQIALDIGGSAGYAAKELSKHIRRVFVIDIDKQAIELGRKQNNSTNIIYKIGDAMKMPFRNKSIDIIICNQVYEHVPNYCTLVEEIRRVLTDDGFCYFSAGNRFALVEQHYRLPFLSWLPKKVSNIYLKVFRGKPYYYENLLSYSGLKKLLKTFEIKDYTLEVIKNPIKYYAIDQIKQHSLISCLPKFVLKILKPVIPGYIFIIKK